MCFMKNLRLTACCCFLILLIFPSCQSSYEKVENGIIVNLKNTKENNAKKIRLEVLTNDIIHVSATPSSRFSDKVNLIQADKVPHLSDFKVKEENGEIQLLTSSLIAHVNRSTGEVDFTDLKGQSILSENKGSGKSFTPIEVDGAKGYSMQQVFESDSTEAFYGLGQHQSNEFNYKGKNESLYQYNTKVSIPFVLSSKNYGILWHNYSYSKFGDSREYANLDQFRLYDKDGKEGGLTATYMVGGDSNDVFVERDEKKIDYENLETVKNFPENFPFGNARITWEGEIVPKESGTYHFILYYAGYTKVYVNDSLVVPERWRTSWNPNSFKFTLNLTKGQRNKLKLDWKPDGGVSYIGLKALSPRPAAEQNKLALWSEIGQQIDYYFIKGDNPDQVISGYRTVTGKSPIMPKWAMGYWQSRERYKTQDELLTALSEYRKRQIPIDNIVLDWSYWPVDAWGSHDFDTARFPNPVVMIDSVHKLNARIMISVWPKFYVTTENYKAFDKNGWMYKQAVKDSVRDWIGKGYIGSFYDAYSDDARKLFWKQMNEKLYAKGIDAWWMDASEPDILSNSSMEYRKKLTNPNALGTSTEYFNAYALENAKAIYNGQRSVNPNNRVFLLTRSGFAGLQRYSTATWSGDIGTRWEDMQAQISAGLNFAMSGVPYWTMDIGGFCVEKRYEKAKEGSEDLKEWRELNNRWFQFGSFCPLFRSHGQFPYREIYNMSPEGSPTYNSMVYYTKLRYKLMPYIYSLAGMTYFNDYTIMRALVMDFENDPTTFNIQDQYMFGPSLMVCPVYQYKQRSRKVYFPKNSSWYDFESNQYISGGVRQLVDAPYEKIPLYVRAGSIIPFGKDIQSTVESQSDDMLLKVYTGSDGKFTIYEDEGTNYNYEKGNYLTIELSYNDKIKELTIGEAHGKYNGMPQTRLFRIAWVSPDGKVHTGKTIQYTGSVQSVTLTD